MDAALEVLRKLTATQLEITLPSTGISIDEIYKRVRSAEAYAYHAQWIAESPDKYQPATRQQIIQNAGEVNTVAYAQARYELELLRRKIKNVFTTIDLLITPTMPSPPVAIAAAANPQR